MSGRVDVGDRHHLALRRFVADRARVVDARPDQRGHRALPHRHRLLHEAAAHPHDFRRLGRRQSADADDRAVFAEGVSGHQIAAGGSFFLENGVQRRRNGEDGRLRVLGQLELIVRPLEAECRERKAERGVDVIEDPPRRRISRGDVLPHPGVLASLPGEDECGVVLHVRRE